MKSCVVVFFTFVMTFLIDAYYNRVSILVRNVSVNLRKSIGLIETLKKKLI